uniref:Uncharacterized protein LOC104216149 n=1 Tax=Nicotiana sylvestris TaxID=4096 RepID=A0A1U7VDN2_NICSY|nr:PREDICTED: uncharacterized protein LOC104216149 [Nicotiana sylvestris]XP_009764454.1 PREDICTED: uncharacterized protein LOC104216149 [Nicotiana sylvestris]
MAKIREFDDCLHYIGRGMDDPELVRCALNSLLVSYESFIVMASNMCPHPTFAELWTMLITHEVRTLPTNDVPSAPLPIALLDGSSSNVTSSSPVGPSSAHGNFGHSRNYHRGQSGRGRGSSQRGRGSPFQQSYGDHYQHN